MVAAQPIRRGHLTLGLGVLNAEPRGAPARGTRAAGRGRCGRGSTALALIRAGIGRPAASSPLTNRGAELPGGVGALRRASLGIGEGSAVAGVLQA